ncbi:MAG: phosphatase PAP2 family protein [Bacteroidetes bacterium]|jgi:undecaprenyl-diphosphatase|nr:phosphatase PAP2 family protein [Bacteroidota bacterium]
MIEFIKNIDTEIFLFLNGLHNSFFDVFFYYSTITVVWIPLFAYLAYLAVKSYGINTWKFLLIIALLILLSDQLSVYIKNEFMRYRPSHNLILKSVVHIVNNKHGGLYSFVSSHATNTMALTVFLILTLLREDRKMQYVMVVYMLIASYSRIYMGLHYPFDILGGWLTGFAIAVILYAIFKNQISKFGIQEKTSGSKSTP